MGVMMFSSHIDTRSPSLSTTGKLRLIDPLQHYI